MPMTQRTLKRFFEELPGPIDHVLVTAGGPHYAPCWRWTSDQVREAMSRPCGAGARGRATCRRQDATRRHAAADGRHRRPADQARPRVIAAATAVLPPFTADSGAGAGADPGQPHRRGLRRHPLVGIASRRRTGGRRDELRATLPIGRVVGPADVAALAVHIMTNTALTGATYDIDGGQQFVCGMTRDHCGATVRPMRERYAVVSGLLQCRGAGPQADPRRGPGRSGRAVLRRAEQRRHPCSGNGVAG